MFEGRECEADSQEIIIEKTLRSKMLMCQVRAFGRESALLVLRNILLQLFLIRMVGLLFQESFILFHRLIF